MKLARVSAAVIGITAVLASALSLIAASPARNGGGASAAGSAELPVAVPALPGGGDSPRVDIGAESFAAADGEYFEYLPGYIGGRGALHWKENGGTVSCSAEIDEPGQYNLGVIYAPLESRGGFIELGVTVQNGGREFELGAVKLDRPLLPGGITQDAAGDDLRPSAAADTGVNEKILRAGDGFEDEPFMLELERGAAEIEITGRRTEFMLLGVSFLPIPHIPSGEELRRAYAEQGWPMAKTGAKTQAEDIYRASVSTLTAQYDRSDALVEPSDPGRMVLNIAGGEGWRSDGQWMEWEIDAPETALYAVRIKARQNIKSGAVSNRRLYIDGKVPAAEANGISFAYSAGWRVVTMEDRNGEEALIPLSRGRHVLRLEAAPGMAVASAVAVRGALGALNDMYREIIMITGTSPDVNRDYYLERDIPGLLTEAARLSGGLSARKAELESRGGYRADGLAALTTLSSQLASFAESPETIPARVSSFKGNIDALSAWLLRDREQPLDLDYIEICPPGSGPAPANAGFARNFVFGARALIASFAPEQNEAEGGALDIWVNMGRDQMKIVQQMSDEAFTPKTGINARFSVVTQGINEAILAGSGPDIVLYVPSGEPAGLAMRGALAPVDGLDGYGELSGEWQADAAVPYEYNGHVYGVPLTQSFPVMFYRADILGGLGIDPPRTWGELCAAIPVIQRKNMQVGVPSGEATFASMLFQAGGGFYNAGRTATTFAQSDAVDVFKRYTRFFSDYGLPVSYDFFNRFRSGEMPIAIADYTESSRLNSAAPEIAGLWGMALIPGTERQGGIDRSAAASGGRGAYILASSGHKDEAWEFLRWFAGYGAQAEFGLASEALMGAAGRYAPSSLLAFDYLPWLAEESAVLKEQWRHVRENPQPPGAYYTQRNILNAFRNVVFYQENPREMLEKYGGEIDRELERKRAEYSLTGEGKAG